MGESYSVADPYLFTLASWLGSDGVDIAKFRRVADHAQRMAERDSVKRAYAMESAA
jgi:glutathione S-transferase